MKRRARRDEGLLKERSPVALGMNQFVELIDLIAQLNGKRVGLKLAGVADCFHCTKRLFGNFNPIVGTRLAETGKLI